VQSGTPAELYDDPVDDFAAVFIGSPSMNLVPARVETDGLYAGGQLLRLPGETTRKVRLTSAGSVQVGIRPHDVMPWGESGGQGVVDVSIVDSYAIGRERFFDFTLGEYPMKGVSSETVEPGKVKHVRLDPTRLLLFTPEGQRIRV
jgi:multiple sugar transport system ATP-binding protein